MENKEFIEECGSCRMSIDEMAIILEVDTAELEKDYENKKGDFYKAYQKGMLQTEMKIRKAIIKMAEQGSTPAQNLYYEKFSRKRGIRA